MCLPMPPSWFSCLVRFLNSIVDRYIFIATLFFILLILFFLNKSIYISYNRTSGEDGDIGRYTLPPYTNKTKTTTNLKAKKQPELTGN